MKKLVLVFCLCLVATVGCSSSSDGGVVSPICLSFAGGTAPAADTVVLREGAGSVCQTLEIEVVATDITNSDVFGAAFTVNYDPAIAFYQGFVITDSHLASDGETLTCIDGVGLSPCSDPGGPSGGQVTISVTRTGSAPEIDFSGTQLLGVLRFSSVASGGPSPIGFSDEKLLDGGDPGMNLPPAEIPGVTWSGAMLEAQ